MTDPIYYMYYYYLFDLFLYEYIFSYLYNITTPTYTRHTVVNPLNIHSWVVTTLRKESLKNIVKKEENTD